jgi:hypothetical protein
LLGGTGWACRYRGGPAVQGLRVFVKERVVYADLSEPEVPVRTIQVEVAEKTMRRLTFISVLCAFLAAPAFADTYPHGTYSGSARMEYGRIGGYYQGQGGEFTLSQYGGNTVLSNSAYAAGARGEDGDPTSFQTFCVEVAEYVSQPMDLYVSNQNAALSGSGSHAYKGGTGAGDDLDFRTAYLYTQFAIGSLSNYAYTGTVNELTRAQTAAALQRVIWKIEGEDGGIGFDMTFMSVSLNSAQQALASAWLEEATKANWSSIGNVRVLQAYTTGGALAQDQLYLVPIPAAVLLGLLGMTAAGLKLRKFV